MDFLAKILVKFPEKFLERPPINLCSPNTKWIFRPKFRQSSEKNSSNDLLLTYVLLIQSQNFSQNFYLLRILKIPRIWYHFQELLKFLENFLERPLVNLCSPNTKSKFQLKSRFSKNFKNSRNLTSFPRIVEILGKIFRTTSYQLMFS